MYIRIIFHDNDFGDPVRTGLLKLWEWVDLNNTHLLSNKEKDLYKIFQQLHERGVLKTLLDRTIFLEYLHSESEFVTRGLYRDTPTDYSDIKQIDADEIKKPITDYLNMKISFHKTNIFSKKWQNGEHAWLNLENGEVGIF